MKAKALTKKSSKDILNKLEGFKGAISDKEREALGLKKGTYSKDSKTGQILKIGRNTGGAMLKNPKKADLDKDGKLSGYEKKRGMAIEKAMSGKKFGGAMKNKPMKAVLGAIALGAAGALGAKKLLKKKKATANPGKGPIRKGIMGNLVEEKKKELMMGKARGGGMMKKYRKGGGADTGTAGESRSRFGVAKNKLKRLGKRIGRGMGAPITSGREMGDKLRNKIAMAQRDKKKVQTRMGGGLAAATKRLKAQGKMGGGMMQRPMGYDKGGMKGKKKPIIKIAIGVGKAKDYPGIKKIMEMNKKGKKRFNTGGSVTVSSKLGRTKPTKLY